MDLDTFVAAGVAFGGKVPGQVQNMAIRYGLSVVAGFVGQQLTRVVKKVDDKPLYREMKELQDALTTKMKVCIQVPYPLQIVSLITLQVISPAIDLIELK
jgi:hypothetical protein